jgi:hypothetical protein
MMVGSAAGGEHAKDSSDPNSKRTTVPHSSSLTTAPTDTAAVDEMIASSGSSYETARARRKGDPFGRFRRNVLHGDAESQRHGRELDDEAELKVQMMLLREENARLKADRHHPSDVGTMIDELRLVADEEEGELLDDAWSLLSECLVIREGLAQACLEIEAAAGAVRERLDTLAVRIEELARNDSLVPDASVMHASQAS